MEIDDARFFLHGDESDAEPGAYFCRNCNAFLPDGHFRSPCLNESHAAIYAHHYRNFLTLAKLGRVNRPESARGIADRFQDAPAA